MFIPLLRKSLPLLLASSLISVHAQNEPKDATKIVITDSAESANFTPKENYRDLNELVRDYMTANGGRSYLEEQKSIRMIGSYSDGTTKLDITTFRKRPNLVRTNFQADEYKLSLGYDGVMVWQSLERSGLVTSGQLSGADASDFRLHSYFLHPFYNMRETGKWLTFVGKEKFAGRDCWRVDMKSEDFSVQFYHSCDNLNELGSISTVNAGGKDSVIEIRKDDYRLVERMLLPHKITTLKDGKVVGVYEFTNMTVNHGITDSYFRKPAPRFNR